jgi:hypothetical protein
MMSLELRLRSCQLAVKSKDRTKSLSLANQSINSGIRYHVARDHGTIGHLITMESPGRWSHGNTMGFGLRVTGLAGGEELVTV